MINWKNAELQLCLICDKSLKENSYWICQKCHKMCATNVAKELGNNMFDIKSKCCNADVISHRRQTCSDECHKKLITEMTKEFGEFKKITDIESGIAYKVPTKDIVEKGIQYEELPRYQRW